jgi:hypothetical protein
VNQSCWLSANVCTIHKVIADVVVFKILLLKHRLEVNHQITLVHTPRKRLEFLVRFALLVVVLKVLLARKRRHDRNGVALCALVFERPPRFHVQDVGGAVLEGEMLVSVENDTSQNFTSPAEGLLHAGSQQSGGRTLSAF